MSKINPKDTDITTALNKFTRNLFTKGYWQILMFVLIEQSVCYTGVFIILSGTFTSGKMNFKCNIKTSKSNYKSLPNYCGMFDIKLNATVNCTDGYIFYPKDDFVKTSIVQDFKLICDYKYLDGLAQSMVMVGLFVGGILGPILADKFGRRLLVFGSFFIAGIVGIGTSFVNNFYLLLSLNFILGIMREATLSVGFVFGLEFIPDTHQSLYGMLSQVMFSMNIILLGVMAYFIRYWRYLQLVGSIPIVLMSFLIVIVPESPRWLITMGRFETLRNLIDNFVNKINKRKTSSLNNIERLKAAYIQHKKNSKTKADSTEYSGIDIFKTKILLIWSVILILSWVFMVIAYFSMTMLTVHFPGNKYFVFILPVCLEIPGYFVAYFLIQRSRNLTYFFAQIITSACLITIGFMTKQAWIISLLVIAKACTAGCFYVTVVSAIYIFPTTMRSFGTSLPSAISKLLSTFIPYLVQLYTVIKWLPTFMIGVGAIFIAILNIFYPDWVNKPIPETLTDIDNLKKNIGFRFRKSDKPEEPVEHENSLTDIS